MKSYSPLFVSIEQPQLTEADRQMLCHPFVGGVVIFSKNFISWSQIKSLISDIKSLKSPELLVCVDHEGGRVQRFKKDFTIIPPMRLLGQLYDSEPEVALECARACGYIIGAELGEVGVDFSFTPVLDLDYGQSSVIGDRSFHQDSQAVVKLAGSLIAGLAQTGMQAIGKHFPGHGFVVKDSHLELPQDARDFAEIEQKDLVPFAQLHPQLAGLMTAHVLYQRVAPEIASFSPFWLKQILRTQIGYQGLVFSDDLLMKATDPTGNMSMRAIAALDAGCDVLLLCNNDDAVMELLADKTVSEREGFVDYSRLYYQPFAEKMAYEQALTVLAERGLI